MVRLIYLALEILSWQIIRIIMINDEERTEKRIEKSICQVQEIKKVFALENEWLLLVQLIAQQLLIIFLAENVKEFSIAMFLNGIIVSSEAFELKRYKYRVLRRTVIILQRKYSRPENRLFVSLIEENIIGIKAFGDIHYNKQFKVNKLTNLNEIIKYIRIITKQKNNSLKKIKLIKERWLQCQ